MNNYDSNNIVKFRYFFSQFNKDESQKSFDNIKSFVDKIMKDSGDESEYVATQLIFIINELFSLSVGIDIAASDHYNLIKINNYIQENWIEQKIKEPIYLGVNYNLKQFVWLFKILQENNVIQNKKEELINILQVILSADKVEKENIERYMYANHVEEPKKCIFPDLAWDDLFK